MKHNLIATIFLIQILTSSAQNLVLNGGFEDFTSCPDSTEQVKRAYPWIQPTGGTSDFYHACNGSNCDALQVGVPCNGLGFQVPHSGEGYAGFITFGNRYNPALRELVPYYYSEYIQAPLSDKLVKDQLYEVSFYANLADSSDYATKLQVYFSENSITAPSNDYLDTITFHIESSEIISNKSDWVKVCGVYEARGGEGHITIGLFGERDSLDFLDINDGTFYGGGAYLAYYFIDDVRVSPTFIELDTLDLDVDLCDLNDSVVLQAPNGGTAYLWSNGSQADSLMVFSEGTYSVDIEYACQFGKKEYTVAPYDTEIPDYATNDTFCVGDTFFLSNTSEIAYSWNGEDSGEAIEILQDDTFILTAVTACEVAEDTVYAYLYPEAAFPDFGEVDSFICEGESLTIDAELSVFASYQWQDGSTNSFYVASEPNIYSVLITTDCWTNLFEKELENNCACMPFVPNAFTPNQDEENDHFTIRFNCPIIEYELSIFDRYGQLIFKTNDRSDKWDGTTQGENVNAGVYVYHVNMRYIEIFEEKSTQLTGNVQVLR